MAARVSRAWDRPRRADRGGFADRGRLRAVDRRRRSARAESGKPGRAAQPTHLMGTDKLGRDVFARIVYGTRISIRIGFVAVGIAITIGTLIGVIAAYVGGKTDQLLMGAMEIMLAFPSIILAIAITTILGPSITNLMIAVGIVYIPQYARLARSP